MKKIIVVNIVFCFFVATLAVQPALTFPISDSSWSPVKKNGANLVDPAGDVSGGGDVFDIVGGSTSASLHVSDDANNFYSRFRMADTPVDGIKFKSISYFFLIDTDYNFSNYEYSIVFDGPSERLTFERISDNSQQYYPASGTDARVRIEEALDGPYGLLSADYFVDFSIPLIDMINFGIDLSAPMSFWAGTGSSSSGINKDFIGSLDSFASSVSDPIVVAPVPEPSTFLLLGGGLVGLAFVVLRRKKE